MTTTLKSPASPRPFHALIKPIGPICNLDCTYCFYLDKEKLFPKTPSFRMSEETLEALTKSYIESQPPGAPEMNFGWQGGEPTLMGVDFFRKAIAFQKQYARPGLSIVNSIQTNGTLLDDEWGELLAEGKFLVGLSIDGPRELHDQWRVDKKGAATFDRVMQGLDVLRRHKVDFNTLTVLNKDNSRHPREMYDFLVSIGSTFFQFIPLVERDAEGGIHPRSVDPEIYGDFLSGLFDRWLRREDIGRIFVQDFDLTLTLAMGLPSPLCTHSETCGRAVAVEHNGTVFSCDHFVNPEDRIGSVMEDAFAQIVDGPQQAHFGNAKRDTLPRYCRECEFLTLCWGGCPKDRLIQTPDGEPGLNYLCAGFKKFFRHSLPTFLKMARCLEMGRAAADWRMIDQMEQQQQAQMQSPRPAANTARNAPCPCGSGLKYKRCCGSSDA